MSDLSRVLRGTRLVAAAALARATTADRQHYSRLWDHAVGIKDAMWSHYSHAAESESARTSSDAARGTASPSAVEKPDSLREKDLIGFSAVSGEEGEKDFKHLLETSSKVNMRERSIPSSQLSRLVGFGGLGARMAAGLAFETVFGGGSSQQGGSSLSDENAERLAETLCRMRGAALKLGQMLSVQDEGMLPPALARALERVKQNADYMPAKQLNEVLGGELGSAWRFRFKEFHDKPIAAASIGQVHKAVLMDGTVVAVKVQYPGVAQSIGSDLANLKTLVTMTNLVPRGLFIDEIMRVASEELAEECDYLKEAAHQSRYRGLIESDPILRKHTSVPRIYEALTTSSVITSDFVQGVSIEKAIELPQSVRNAIARTMLVLAMKELFEWRLVQSDPNFANYLYDHPRKTIHCIDFGATRTYSKEFVDGYLEIVWAAANKDRVSVLQVSRRLGFLSGDENEEMNAAHVDAALLLGEPFISSEPYDFGNSQLTTKIGDYGSTFMKYRLKPPPREAYSLHRKLAGAFLLCIKLKAKISCRDILESTHRHYDFT